jgi:hypothetical protein
MISAGMSSPSQTFTISPTTKFCNMSRVIKERRLKKEIKKTKTLNRSNDEIKCEC